MEKTSNIDKILCKNCWHNEELAKNRNCDCRLCIWNEGGFNIRNKM